MRMASLTFMKYCGPGFGEDKPAQPGERKGVVKDLERTVKGYRMLMRELERLRVVLEQQESARDRSKMEKTHRTRYYKSQLGIRLVYVVDTLLVSSRFGDLHYQICRY